MIKNLLILLIVGGCFSTTVCACEKVEDSVKVIFNKWKEDTSGCLRGEIYGLVVDKVKKMKISPRKLKKYLGTPLREKSEGGYIRITYDYYGCDDKGYKWDTFFVTFVFRKRKIVDVNSLHSG